MTANSRFSYLLSNQVNPTIMDDIIVYMRGSRGKGNAPVSPRWSVNNYWDALKWTIKSLCP